LFSGLITVGFLDQLKLHRERHPKMAVAETIMIKQTYREHVVTELQSQNTTAVTSERGRAAAVPGICPHCGSAFSYAAVHKDSRGEPFGA
jgi:hypothetical protein